MKPMSSRSQSELERVKSMRLEGYLKSAVLEEDVHSDDLIPWILEKLSVLGILNEDNKIECPNILCPYSFVGDDSNQEVVQHYIDRHYWLGG